MPVFTAHDARTNTGNRQEFYTAQESRVGSIGSTIDNGSNHPSINVNFNSYIGESSVESIDLKQLTTVAAAPVMTNVVLLANAPFAQPWLSQRKCVRWRQRLRGWASSLSIPKAPSHVESRLMKLRLD